MKPSFFTSTPQNCRQQTERRSASTCRAFRCSDHLLLWHCWIHITLFRKYTHTSCGDVKRLIQLFRQQYWCSRCL